MKTLLWSVLVALALFFPVAAQPVYWGVFPSVLVEPYDDVEALEVNLIPLILGFELSPGLRLEVRPLVDLQLLEGRSPALSHLGGTFALTKTFLGESPRVSWHLGGFLSANVNAIDGGVVVISGSSPESRGLRMISSLSRFHLSRASIGFCGPVQVRRLCFPTWDSWSTSAGQQEKPTSVVTGAPGNE